MTTDSISEMNLSNMTRSPSEYNKEIANPFAITIDVDWAPDFVINSVAETLVQHQVKCTWFVTHDSPAILSLKNEPELFEIGIHPNFMSNSTQGNSPEEICDYCFSIVSNAVTCRTHALMQSAPLLSLLLENGIKYDASLFLPYQTHLSLVEYYFPKGKLIRLPYFWEDDHEMYRNPPAWSLEQVPHQSSGLKIFDFHPIHIYLNSKDMVPYRKIICSTNKLQSVSKRTMSQHVQDGNGTKTIFLELLKYMSEFRNHNRLCDLGAKLEATSQIDRLT